jgi:hypothetical protein
MASTRSKNTPGNFELEFSYKAAQADYLLNDIKSFPVETAFPGDTLLSGRVGPFKLSSNFCDIESQLLGIGSSNLVKPLVPVTPDIYTLKSLKIMDRVPLIMPQPFVQSNQERHLPGGK